MLPQEIIRAKRNGGVLSGDDIGAFIAGLTSGAVTDAQAAAFAMAVYFRGMTVDERVALTTAMRDSGAVLDWSHLPGPALDKHSTGGVGDNISLMLAPALAACGVFVPMISGRGLGHTGGTLDKLDSIPGYTSQPDIETFRRVTADVGCAIIGQTADLAPADRRLYAIRDISATVESIDLITASILSKKLAAGLDALVLDVKTGTGAFMASLEDARALAGALTDVANGAGTRCSALITDMNQPLARAAGNAVEVRDAIDFLTGARRDARVWEVTCALGAGALALCGQDNARARIEQAFDSGAAAERFVRMVAALGGPADLMEAPDAHLPAAPVVRVVEGADTVTAIDTRRIGIAVIELGGGRRRAADAIDPAVGFTALTGIGEAGPLGTIHARDDAAADRAEAALRAAVTIGPAQDTMPHPVIDRIGP